MRCKVCGREMKSTRGVHYIGDRWLLLDAEYCYKHGSFVSNLALQNAEEVVPDTTQREHIRPGLHVMIHTKYDGCIQQPVEGYVKEIIASSLYDYRGIKVRLTDGQRGNVVRILK